MSESSEFDQELAELRARRRAELVRPTAPAPTPRAPSPAPEVVTSGNLRSFLGDHPQAVLDIWAPWCGPCRTVGPMVDRLADELAPHVAFGKVNADDEPMLVQGWGVEGIPTLILFREGRPVDRIVGALPFDALRQRIVRAFPAGSTARPTAPE